MSTPGFSMRDVYASGAGPARAERLERRRPDPGPVTPGGQPHPGRARTRPSWPPVSWRAWRPGARAVVASDLARTAETAAIIAGRLGLPLEFDPRLREQDLGQLEGTRSVADDGPRGSTGDVIDQFWDDPYRRPPGGETVAELYKRVHGALSGLAEGRPGIDLIVVTHGGPVRVATADRLPPPGLPLPRAAVGNASISLWPGPADTGRADAHTEMVAP